MIRGYFLLIKPERSFRAFSAEKWGGDEAGQFEDGQNNRRIIIQTWTIKDRSNAGRPLHCRGELCKLIHNQLIDCWKIFHTKCSAQRNPLADVEQQVQRRTGEIPEGRKGATSKFSRSTRHSFPTSPVSSSLMKVCPYAQSHMI